ncbi:MAG: membrane dipeptidase [Spirochaetales bacterium]|nr:membrane dipeptidase [Spirochaetales bacterium]
MEDVGPSDRRAKKLIDDIIYFDIHGHREKLLPPILRVIPSTRIPRDVKLSGLADTGVNGFIICAIGDPNSFKKWKTDSYKSVMKQLDEIRKSIARAGGVIALSSSDIEKASTDGKPVFVLGIEGGDFIGEDLNRLSFVYNQGVRLLVPMHYSKNLIGSISLGWGGRVVPDREQTGLTSFGKELIEEAGELGMLIDLAHADERTILDVVKITTAPVLCSHTGPRSLQNFPRYISDKAMKAIAGTGGLVGLWPFFSKGAGVEDLETFINYARYMADLIGTEHLAFGTDINGVPGNMKGYENLNDAFVLIQTLLDGGFNENELKMIAGENFLRFFNTTMKSDR